MLQTIGENLKKLRKLYRVQISVLSEFLSISEEDYQLLEKGEFSISSTMLEKLDTLFMVDLTKEIDVSTLSVNSMATLSVQELNNIVAITELRTTKVARFLWNAKRQVVRYAMI